MEIIRRGIILPEEEDVANQLKKLPDHWWCIGGDSNRYSFRKGEGTQIDFLVIAPKGIFLIDAKNINTIELLDGNTLRFISATGKQIRKTLKRENPVEEIIDERYQAKDWLRAKGISDFLTKDGKDVSVFLHGLVVLSNEKKIKYKNCQLDKISYYTHKYPALIPISKLTQDFFDSIHLPSNCKELSQEEMWALYKIFYNPDMSLSQILSQVKKEEDTLLQQKQVFLEKIRLIEQENLDLNQKTKDLEGMRNNLLSTNQELISNVNNLESKLNTSLDEIKSQKEYTDKLIEDNKDLIKYKETENELFEYREKLDESTKKLKFVENENKKLKLKKEKKVPKQTTQQLIYFKVATSILLVLFLGSISYFYIFLTNQSFNLTINPSNTFSTIEKIFPTMENLFNENKYKKLVNIWQKQVLNEKDFEIKDYHRYDSLFFYIAKSYQQIKSHTKAITYYDIYTEIAQEPKLLLEAYFNRSVSHIYLKSEYHRAIFALSKAFRINNKQINSYDWRIKILKKLGQIYHIIDNLKDAKKNDYAILLKVKNFNEKALKFYKMGRDIASREGDTYNQADFQSEIGNLYMDKKRYQRAINRFKDTLLLLQSMVNSNKALNKEMLIYNSVGKCYYQLRKIKLSLQNYLEALKLSEELKLTKKEATYSYIIGTIYYNQILYEKAMSYLKRAYQIAEELKLPELENYRNQYQKTKKLI